MSSYTRTAIRHLSIRGFRSIRSLELDLIPDVVVLHGPNGAGKSNILRASQLALRAVSIRGNLPIGRGQARSISMIDANKMLDLRSNDFHFGFAEIRIKLEVALGTKAGEILQLSTAKHPTTLSLDFVIQLISNSEMQYWFEQADGDGESLGPTSDDAASSDLRRQIEEIEEKIGRQRPIVAGEEAALINLDFQNDGMDIAAQRAAATQRVKGQTESLRKMESQLQKLETQFDPPTLLKQRIRYTLVPQLIQLSPAYRVPGDTNDPEVALHRAALSESGPQANALQRLGRRLAAIELLGDNTGSIGLRPVSNRYGERAIHLTHPTRGELPIRNLGSGEQQIVYLLAQRVITPFPIAHLEEPEAHLHTTLMARLAQVLHDSVVGEPNVPDVDQLWIATHHHHFALAREYYDVMLKEGATTVNLLPRAKAATHFYEPGPIWEALRQLAGSAKTENAVVFRDANNQPVTAKEILDSIHHDPTQRVAKEYARAMTEAMVMAMRQRSEKPS